MRKVLILGLLGLIAACVPADIPADPPTDEPEEIVSEPTATATMMEEADLVNLRDYGPAPELINEVWLNTPKPLRLADLRGQVVLLEMWTFG